MKTAEDLSKLLEIALTEFSLEKDKIFMLLRDGASVMTKLGRIAGLESTHCLAHSLQLVSIFPEFFLPPYCYFSASRMLSKS